MSLRNSAAALAAVLVTALGGATAANAANLVQNGDFEAGYAGWNYNGWFEASNGYGGVPAYQGSQFASTGCVYSYCNLSQDLSTVAGTTYDLSFAFNPGNGADWGGGDTHVFWDGNLIADFNGGANAWTTYNFTGLLATSGTTNLTFSGYQNPAYNGVDAVSVMGSSGAVPEPAVWGLMLLGFAAMGSALRSNRRRTVALAA